MPEGWWHQIDSTSETIAVNIWWRSAFDRLLGSHMDSYYLRRALQSLTSAHKAQLLRRPVFMGSQTQHSRDGASLAGATGPGDREECCSTVHRGVEQDSSRSQQGETRPACGHLAAQHGSSASRAEAAGDGGLDDQRIAKRLRPERSCTRSDKGAVSQSGENKKRSPAALAYADAAPEVLSYEGEHCGTTVKHVRTTDLCCGSSSVA